MRPAPGAGAWRRPRGSASRSCRSATSSTSPSPSPGVEPLQPIVRLLEASVYVRYADGGLMFGGYEEAPQVVEPEASRVRLPDRRSAARLRRPACTDRRGGRAFPGAQVGGSRHPPRRLADDDRRTATPSWGPYPDSTGSTSRPGCCVGGLSLSPSAGRALADLILDGKSEPDLASLCGRALSRLGGAPGRARVRACVERYARKYMK